MVEQQRRRVFVEPAGTGMGDAAAAAEAEGAQPESSASVALVRTGGDNEQRELAFAQTQAMARALVPKAMHTIDECLSVRRPMVRLRAAQLVLELAQRAPVGAWVPPDFGQWPLAEQVAWMGAFHRRVGEVLNLLRSQARATSLNSAESATVDRVDVVDLNSAVE